MTAVNILALTMTLVLYISVYAPKGPDRVRARLILAAVVAAVVAVIV